MSHGSADDVARKWAQNLGAAGPSIQAGVQRVQTAPGQAAAHNKAGYLAGVQSSADKWARNVQQVSLGDWQQAMINKGLSRIAGGATAATPKFTAAMAKLLPFIDAGKASLPPRGGFDANVARSAAWLRYMHGYQR